MNETTEFRNVPAGKLDGLQIPPDVVLVEGDENGELTFWTERSLEKAWRDRIEAKLDELLDLLRPKEWTDAYTSLEGALRDER